MGRGGDRGGGPGAVPGRGPPPRSGDGHRQVLPPGFPAHPGDGLRRGEVRREPSDERGGGYRPARWPQGSPSARICGRTPSLHGVAWPGGRYILAGGPHQGDELHPTRG